VGSKVRARVFLQELQEVTGGAQAVLKYVVKVLRNSDNFISGRVTLEMEGKDKPAVGAEWVVRIYE
jgi:hypothetical protein